MSCIWKPVNVEGFENLYEVSNTGEVRRSAQVYVDHDGWVSTTKEHILKPFHSKKYHAVKLCRIEDDGTHTQKSMTVHRIVAKTFIPNPENKPEVNHIDGNQHNNVVENLEWVTKEENTRHAVENKLIVSGKKGNLSARAQAVAMYNLNGEYLTSFGSIVDAANFLGITTSPKISGACTGRRNTAHGYIWRHIKDGEAVETKVPGVTHMPYVMDQVKRNTFDVFRSAEIQDKLNSKNNPE